MYSKLFSDLENRVRKKCKLFSAILLGYILFIYFKRFYSFIFRERGRGGEKAGEKH